MKLFIMQHHLFQLLNSFCFPDVQNTQVVIRQQGADEQMYSHPLADFLQCKTSHPKGDHSLKHHNTITIL